MILFPNAKINLGLNILQRRPSDGYHLIESIMLPIGWHDILEIVPAQGSATTLTISGRNVDCPVESNLVMKAYRALSSTIPIPNVDIYLRKVIPDGAGLGGGSSDAAFTLLGLNDLFALNLEPNQLAAIAATIGADCPFFIYNRPMLSTGIGTTLTPVELTLQGLKIAVIKPMASVTTKQAYAKVIPSIPETPLRNAILAPIEKWQQTITNDFEASVTPLLPIISQIKQELTTTGAIYTAMSGSGSAVYGIFKGDIMAETLKSKFTDCDIWIGKLN